MPCNDIDKQLFRASTKVTVGNGETARFWESSWLEGRAPRDLAPNLFKLAWRKNNTVKDDLQNQNWTRGLMRMTTAEEMAELVFLWGKIDEVQLNNQPDQIIWKWTSNRLYSTKSAYNIQFKGSFCSFNTKAIWRAKSEGKHMVFASQLVQSKILTADNLIARNWPCDPICALCDQAPETAEQICLHCVYAREVWFLVSQWSNGLVGIPDHGCEIEEWWNRGVSGQPKEKGRRVSVLMIYTAWNLWKERNKRIFQGEFTTIVRVLELIKEEIKTRMLAMGEREEFLVF